MPENKDLSLE